MKRRDFSSIELAPLSSKVEVRWINEIRGYGLIALEDIKEGEVIIDKEPPFVATLTPGPTQRCSLCWRRCSTDFTCSCGIRYCCLQCKETDYQAHSILCTGPINDENHPLITFKINALNTNEMFLTAARAIALELIKPMTISRRFENFQYMKWEEAVPCPKEEENSIEFAQKLKELAENSQKQLETALLLLNSIEKSAIIEGTSRFSEWLGCFERNQFGIRILEEEEEEGHEEVEEEVDGHIHGKEDDGAGIFSLCCCANHDCSPNAEIVFVSNTNEATMRCIRDVKKNEEICISYIDEDSELDERQEEIYDYGFYCHCFRCVTEERWIKEQERLSSLVILEGQPQVKLIGGFDISFPENDKEDSIACFTVLSYPDLKVMYESLEEVQMTEPYIPGFLAFREAKICLTMLQNVPLQFRPDVLILDGCGIMHPRQCGLASHVGVLCDVPTIGVSKKLFCVDGLNRDKMKKVVTNRLNKGIRETELIGDSGRVWGKAYVPESAKNPVFISIGHRIDLDYAVDIVKVACGKTRVPAPIRHSDLASRDAIRKRQKESNNN